MGAHDLYPFVLAPKVLEKLRFVHDLVTAHIPYRTPRRGGRAGAGLSRRRPLRRPSADRHASAERGGVEHQRHAEDAAIPAQNPPTTSVG